MPDGVAAQAVGPAATYYTCARPTSWTSTPMAWATPPANIDWRTSWPPVVTSVKHQGLVRAPGSPCSGPPHVA